MYEILYRSEFERYAQALKASANLNQSEKSYGLFGSAGLSVGAFLTPPGSTLPQIQVTFFPQVSEPHLSKSRHVTNMEDDFVFTVALLKPEARNHVVVSSKNHKVLDKTMCFNFGHLYLLLHMHLGTLQSYTGDSRAPK